MSEAIRQLALPLETHRNHFLFSDHYLNEVLPHQAAWHQVETEAQEALAAIAKLYDQKAGALPHCHEAALEQEWIRPVLDILGHAYHVQPSLADALGTPDYAFFSDETTKQAAAPLRGTPAFWETALAVGDAKRWDRPLDKRIVNGAPDAFTNANPCFQIDTYLRRTGCAWGMVSNGRQWRLYHRESSYRLDVFYEVDLVQLIKQGRLDAFRYFLLFFSAAAFQPDAEEPALSLSKGRCWLDEVLAQSAAYAVRVGDELKGRVYEALRLLAQGFLDYPVRANPGGRPLDPAADLPHIHDACLILLYRLLFLLYAESRGLLPLDNPSYARQYSLKAIKEDIARKRDDGVVYLPQRATIWDDLRALFDIIYGGQAALGVPAYDGGLFDPTRHPFLKEHPIGDRYLAAALDLLARAGAEAGQGLSFVDYRDLSIRHLGSIYEGLLEYRLAHAAKEMAVVRRGKKKSEAIVPASEVEQAPVVSRAEPRVIERIPTGQVYLITDRGERKATGSYYTPDYIVKYIVEQTLGPLADAQAKAVQAEVAALKAKNKGGARRTKAYKDELARLQNSFADRVLALNVLDPAMGSGHFLVEATDYLARRIVEAGVTTPELGDGNDESELSYWRRRVVERCIYGVDLNPLAVELAKLSLWLTTVARGKPLSFLDHHLRCGNSLIGARVADLHALPEKKKTRRVSETSQLAMWDESAFTQDMFRVVGAMRHIQDYESADLVSVREKERLFAETVERERGKWRQVADLWTATYFGLALTPELYKACADHAQGRPVLLGAAQAEALLAQARELWRQKRFFHWELEFPEVFFDQYGRHKGEAAGFDAVMGNPPYVSVRDLINLAPDERGYFTLSSEYRSATHVWDLYMLMSEKSFNQLKTDGRCSFIVPVMFLHQQNAEALRRCFLENGSVGRIIDLSNINVFDEAIVKVAIFVVTKTMDSTLRRENISIYKPQDAAELGTGGGFLYWADPTEIAQSADAAFRTDLSARALTIVRRIHEQSISLNHLLYPTFGLRPSPKQKGLGTKDRLLALHKVSDDARPYLEGRDVARYETKWSGRYVLYRPEEMYSGRFPELFDFPKVLVRAVLAGKSLIATVDEKGFYADQTLVCCARPENVSKRANVGVAKPSQYDLHFIAAQLNSSLESFYFIASLVSDSLGGGAIHCTPGTTARLPIRRIAFTTPPGERARLAKEGKELVEAALTPALAALGHPLSQAWERGTGGEGSPLGRWLDARLEAEPEQTDVVHDLLAFLAEQMIDMNKAKQAEARAFLDWLVGYTGRPVDDWALKTSLRRYYRHDWAEMQRVLKRNQRKLPDVALDVDAYRSEPAAKIRAAWETSMEVLRPLLARIAATDRLIDRIVYQLYGLTEQEIAIVEAK